jgi:hypothetical protein
MTGFVVPFRALVAGVALLALAVLAFPALRDQAALSLTRQPAGFTALALGDASVARACASIHAGRGFDVVVENDMGRDIGYHYQAVVSPARGRAVTRSGWLAVPAGGQGHQHVSVPGPVARGATAVTVVLTGRAEHLSLRCGGGPAAGS